MKILVTGAAGFIGHATSLRLLSRGDKVIGVDNVNPYYDVRLKEDRLSNLFDYESFIFERCDVSDRSYISDVFCKYKVDCVVHLAAQAGVRYSLENPEVYIDSNVVGFLNILEGCRRNKVGHLVYASSSSVYGANTKLPFTVSDNVDHPVSLYAATKKANELMAHSYSHLYELPTTGLRFFTVYGPWGRPDMCLFLFTRKILSGEPIDIFNYGHHQRDFTYIDDVVEGVVRVVDRAAKGDANWSGNSPDPGSSRAPYRVYNIGNNDPVKLEDFIEVLEEALGQKARRNLLPIQPGDVPDTFADVSDLLAEFDFEPSTSVTVGVRRFVDWYIDYYGVE